MSAITDIIGQLPIADLAKQVGASEAQTKSASTQVVTSLLGGLTANAQDAQGEQSLASALVGHLTSGNAFGSDGVKLDAVDTNDGSKIVKHVLGADTAKSAAAIAEKTGGDQSLLQKLLPLLAPVVLGYIATKAMPGKTGADGSSDGGIGSLVGGLLGGSSGGVGSLVGGLLGGGSTGGSNSSGLGSMLSGLLGGALGGSKQTGKTQSSGGLGGLLDAIF
ncbi:MAG: DUF937 domain-containing protein [Propionibacteriaceae bacterium]|nr:DUF937 domain-containing protein [Propionibacteriaceae bacterium]